MQPIIHIVAGGPRTYIPDLSNYHSSEVIWVGVDFGVMYLIQNNIHPSLAFGDFDSVTKDQWEQLKQITNNIKKYKPEKDETDMELAFLWAINQNPRIIRIFGATGGRMDHFMANVMILTREESIGCTIEVIDKQNIISVFSPGRYTINKIDKRSYISFIPLSKHVEGITLLGFKYPLENKNIQMGTTLCISNELIEETGTFSFTSGILMMIRSED
ncbi:thiamine diphosphokinase [Heyndrickxia oleronia]|uniref:thiamine diphosphokinase n=1 Tax=Heyndrickxia oleronia TaxID=38875 RepID=UPI001C0EBC6E|nr:thiamine diphosphokinase [Heyndrickxia oleronia]MBU5211018.1 thiamine diphosphokinase [Heyndrickxia oleronia]